MRQCPLSSSPASIGLGALHPALAEPIARALSCALPCHGATLFGCFSAKMLATEANSTHGIWPAGFWPTLDSSKGAYPMSRITCSQGGHLISKAFSSAWTPRHLCLPASWRASQRQCNPRKPYFQCISVRAGWQAQQGLHSYEGFNSNCMEQAEGELL